MRFVLISSAVLLALMAGQSLAAFNGNDIKCTSLKSLPAKAKSWHHLAKGEVSGQQTEIIDQGWTINFWSEASREVPNTGRVAKAAFWGSRKDLVLEEYNIDKKDEPMSESIFEIAWKSSSPKLPPVKQYWVLPADKKASSKKCTVNIPSGQGDFTLNAFIAP